MERAREEAAEVRRDVREREQQERQVMRAERERSVQNTLYFGMEPVHVMS